MISMKMHQGMMWMLVCVLTTGVLGGAAAAGGESLESLKESFAKRLPKLTEAKHAGKIGETTAGLVEAVKGDADVAKLVSEENADRQSLYVLIAKKENTSVETVAERAARRNFDKAAVGDWLKSKDGAWKQKK